MATDPTTCSYVQDFPEYRCPLPVESGQPVCILHDANPAKNQGVFLEALHRKILQDSTDPGATRVRLDGAVFPGEFRWAMAVAGVATTKGVSFSGATFTGNADFSWATFTGNAYFPKATFTGNVDFSAVTFGGNADFRLATFTGGAYFSAVTFGGNADFSQATFTGDAAFFWATFTGNADFSRAKFTGNTDFSRAKFTGNADFSRAKFTGNANFSGATFRQRLVLRSINRRDQEQDAAPAKAAPGDATGMNRAFTLDFSSVILEQPQMVSFEDVDLSKAAFLYTNLSQVRFIAVTWARKEERLWLFPLVKTNHNAIGDHMELEGKWETLASDERQQQAALVADEYRQLRLNLEGTRQEIEAGHFYIGQMDIRLLDSGLPRLHRWPLHIYRWFAMYGESAWRPLFLYLLSSLCFAFLYLWCGFGWNNNPLPVQLGPFWSGGFTFPISDYGKAWFIAATAGALLRNNIQFVGSWGYVVFFLNMVLGIFFIALFVIALRRHFRR